MLTFIYSFNLNTLKTFFLNGEETGSEQLFNLPNVIVSKLEGLYLRLCVCVYVSHSVVSLSLGPHSLQPARILCTWDSPSRNTRVVYRSFLQGIFPTQGLNTGLQHCRQILYCWSYLETNTSKLV